MIGVSEMRICLAHRWYQTTKPEMVCHWPENEYSIGMYILISHASARVQATGGFVLSKFLLAHLEVKNGAYPLFLNQGKNTGSGRSTKNKMLAKHLQGSGPVPSRAAIHHRKIPGFSRQDIELEPDSHLGAGACGVAPRLTFRRCWWTQGVPAVRFGRDYIAVIAVSSWEE